MCTIIVRLDPHAAESVVVAANRDEVRTRPSDEPAEVRPGIFAGRDRLAGGTWLAIGHRALAAITNIADASRDRDARTRGVLPLAALEGALPSDFAPWNPFNLLVVDRRGARVVTHPGPESSAVVRELGPGTHVIVNALFGAPCPRAEYAKRRLIVHEPTFDLLADHGPPDSLGLCHHGDQYGTVSSTVIALGRDLRVTRYWHRAGLPCSTPTSDLTAAARAVAA